MPEFDKEALKQKRWEEIKKKISFDYIDKSGHEANEEYYHTKPLSPGFAIWKFFAKCPANFLKVDIKIPETLVVLGNNNFCYLHYDPKRKGIVKKNELEINVNQFESIVLKNMDPNYYQP